ncbi:MAG: TonB family protein [Burkholderiales bacterium]|nr:TonB family protein [Burkholderiales bacterium]
MSLNRGPSLPHDLSSRQGWALALCVVLLHGGVGAWVWRSSLAPMPVTDSAPLMVSIISESEPVTTSPQPPQPPQPPAPRQQQQAAPPLSRPQVLASARTAQAQDRQVPAPSSEVRADPLAVAPPATSATTSAVPSTAPAPLTESVSTTAPKTLPSSAVRFLIKPQPVYSQISQELGESGTVVMMVLVDEQGHAKDVQISKSSGYPRLDRAAVAAERAARFQPYIENGTPRNVWVPHSINFTLEDR